jgi:L-aspartate oxidase
VDKVQSAPNIEVLEFHYAVDLITDHHLGKFVTRDSEINCYGAYVLSQKSGELKRINAKVTLLAAGGAGQVYGHTTNPVIASGDGIAMAYRAKAQIADMEYVQFHPTSFYEFGVSPSFLVSEAVRGFGAYLRNKSGERFVLKTDERGELASRDIVSKPLTKN